MEYTAPYSDSLMHFGILGMKWGVRRYQNKDGSLTEEGKKRYSSLVTPEGNYTEKAIKSGFPKKVEKGVANYMIGKRIKDPMVQEVIKQNKAQIDAMIYEERNRQLNQMAMQQHQNMVETQQFADSSQRFTQESLQANNRAASNSMSYGTNPFMFG